MICWEIRYFILLVQALHIKKIKRFWFCPANTGGDLNALIRNQRDQVLQ